MAVPLALSMVDGGGALELRDAEEPFLLEAPTTITGTMDDPSGIIGEATFSTPPVSFELPVLGGALTADIDATISQVTPGSATGAVGPDGGVTLQAAVTVDLHIVVSGARIDARCQSTPVHLDLMSTAPYDPETRSVTLHDPDFTIPALQVTPTCFDIVVDNANPMLAGSGHSVSLTMVGDLVVPSAGTEPSEVTVAVAPEHGAALGTEVVLATSVSPGAGATTVDIPTGLVDIHDRGRKIGSASVVGGVATFTTKTLPLGAHELGVTYRGDSVYRSSTSTSIPYAVSASPVFEVVVPASAVFGAPPVAMPVTLENPSVGVPIENARIGVTLSRFSPAGVALDALAPDAVVLERRTGADAWEPIPLATVPATTTPTLTGLVGPLTGQLLVPGSSMAEDLRISLPSGGPPTRPGPLTVTFSAIEVDPGSGEPGPTVASTSGTLTMRDSGGRAATTTTVSADPAVARQGGTLVVALQTGLVQGIPSIDYHPRGSFRIFVDGQPMLFFEQSLGSATALVESVEYGSDSASTTAYIDLPRSVGFGGHIVTVMFDGDDLFRPSSGSTTFTVVPAVGVPYACTRPDPFTPARFVAFAEVEGRVPAAAAQGGTATVEDLDLVLHVGGSLEEYFATVLVINQSTVEDIVLHIGPDGEGGAESVAIDGLPYLFGGDELGFRLRFGGEGASVSVAGAPGDVLPVTLDGFEILAQGSSGQVTLGCEALGDPHHFGSIVLAGTTVAVDGPAVIRADDEVTLHASVAPSWATGVVEFYAGEELVSIAAINEGSASITVTLPVGPHQVTARARLGASAPSTTSDPVELAVLPAHDCAAFAEGGSAAVVRLVYMELLGRCPDQAGFDFWTGRLDGGVSPETFARSIARTPEAVGRVVDDAYETMLGRPADAAGRAFWTGRLLAHGRYDTLLADLGASDEFWSKAGASNAGFVTRVYGQLLGRSPDQAGQDFWVGRLDAGTSRRALIVSLATLDEPLGVLVADSYDEILSRTPTSGERSDGIAFLRRTGDRSGLYAQLIGRPEFTTRAQTFPNPED